MKLKFCPKDYSILFPTIYTIHLVASLILLFTPTSLSISDVSRTLGVLIIVGGTTLLHCSNSELRLLSASSE